MISKERFIKAIKEFEAIEKDIGGVYNSLKKLDPDFGGFYLSRITTLMVSLLKDTINDEYDYISYFIYELDYGKKWKKGMITDSKGRDIKLQTIEDLYDYITKI